MCRRVHRLVFVRSVVVGVITSLVVSDHRSALAVPAIAFAWSAMSTALRASADRPVPRYRLAVPAMSASAGLFGMRIATSGAATAAG
jgi:hypothetical protein